MPSKSLPSQTRDLSRRLHALLHTLRAIANAEDELCTLLHAAEHADEPSPELLEELQTLLAGMPARECLDDLDAVRSALNVPASRPRAAKALSSKARKPLRAKSSAKRKAAAKPKARKSKS